MLKLWSRKEGFRRPDAPVHAREGSHDFPATFRTRVTHWLLDGLVRLEWDGYGRSYATRDETVHRLYLDLCSAYGRVSLVPRRRAETPLHQLHVHLARCPDVEVMDVIDAVFQESAFFTELGERSEYYFGIGTAEQQRRLANEIDQIFAEEGVGYRRVGDRLVRIDDELTHREAILPALHVLATGRFGHAQGEFGDALADFARGRWRDVLTHANAAFESVLKVLTGRRSGNAGELIKDARQQGLIPSYLGASAESLAATMHALPAARAQQGSAHGLGSAPAQADEHLARLMLALSASFVVFLAAERP